MPAPPSDSSVKSFSLACLFLLATSGASGAQGVVRLDSAALKPGARYGTWSASNGGTTLMGTWTGVADSTHGTVTGTWTLFGPQGKTAAFGGWSAAKVKERWTGAWRANVTGSTAEYSGTWTSSVELKPSAEFAGLFEKAVESIVSGTWSAGARTGAWSIRAAKAGGQANN